MIYYLCFLLFVVLFVEVYFFTLFERSVLGYIQSRSDQMGLGISGWYSLLWMHWNYLQQNLCTHYILFTWFIYFLSWWEYFIFGCLICLSFLYFSMFYLGVLYFMCVSSVSVYVLLASGWSSCSS